MMPLDWIVGPNTAVSLAKVSAAGHERGSASVYPKQASNRKSHLRKMSLSWVPYSSKEHNLWMSFPRVNDLESREPRSRRRLPPRIHTCGPHPRPDIAGSELRRSSFGLKPSSGYRL